MHSLFSVFVFTEKKKHYIFVVHIFRNPFDVRRPWLVVEKFRAQPFLEVTFVYTWETTPQISALNTRRTRALPYNTKFLVEANYVVIYISELSF